MITVMADINKPFSIQRKEKCNYLNIPDTLPAVSYKLATGRILTDLVILILTSLGNC